MPQIQQNICSPAKDIKTFTSRWSETEKLKISVPDNTFFLNLITIKLCTLENIHQKLKLKFS